jgi:zinc D-Ala-D-Ala carboxypeptidase
MKLSKNFDLSEFVNSQTATRKGFAEQFTPADEIINNLETLCSELLQPLRDLLPNGILRISSGYRCERLNREVGGKQTSQHLSGLAADVEYYEHGEERNHVIIDVILKNNLVFDQMIDEFHLSWVHLSYNKKGNRKQYFSI